MLQHLHPLLTLYIPFHFSTSGSTTSTTTAPSISLFIFHFWAPIPKHMMKNMKGKFIKECINKWKNMGSRVTPCAGCEYCCQWVLWPSTRGDKSIPKDVPKGHLVVYVGEKCKRFVIKVSLLNHPLFQALLDQAREEYDFNADSKLCIPCDEDLFLSVVRCASHPRG